MSLLSSSHSKWGGEEQMGLIKANCSPRVVWSLQTLERTKYLLRQYFGHEVRSSGLIFWSKYSTASEGCALSTRGYLLWLNHGSGGIYFRRPTVNIWTCCGSSGKKAHLLQGSSIMLSLNEIQAQTDSLPPSLLRKLKSRVLWPAWHSHLKDFCKSFKNLLQKYIPFRIIISLKFG